MPTTDSAVSQRMVIPAMPSEPEPASSAAVCAHQASPPNRPMLPAPMAASMKMYLSWNSRSMRYVRRLPGALL